MENRGIRLVDDIEKKGTFVGRITYLPKASMAVTAVLAVLLFLTRNRYGIMLGLLLTGILLFVMVMIKDHPVMDVYTDQLIFYDPDDSRYGVSVETDRIAEWNVNKTNMYTICIRLNDGHVYTEECFHSRKAFRYLRQVMPGKDTSTLSRKYFRTLFTRRKRS